MTRRWIAILLILIVVYLARQRMLSASQRLATSVADNLTRLSPASANWAGGAPTGLNLQSLDGPASKLASPASRLAAAPGDGTLAALNAGRRSVVARHQRRDAAKRALKNLQKMERYKEERDGLSSHSFRKPKRVLVTRTKPSGGNPAPSGSPKPSGAPAPSTGARGAARRFAARFGFGSRNAGAQPSPANASGPATPPGVNVPPMGGMGPAKWSEHPMPTSSGLRRRWERRQELRPENRQPGWVMDKFEARWERRQEDHIESLEDKGQLRGMPGWRGWRREERHQIDVQYNERRARAESQYRQDRETLGKEPARKQLNAQLLHDKRAHKDNLRKHRDRWEPKRDPKP